MQRDNYFSLMKGVAILAVLVIHTPFMSEGASAIAARQIVTFAVAMFMFLSGFFSKPEFRWKSITRLGIPYLIWSVLWFAETLWSGSKEITTWSVVNAICFGGAFFPLYFLIVLIELKLITPLIYKYLNGGGYLWYRDWLLLITPLTLAILYWIQYKTGERPAVYAQIFPTWFLIYYCGILAKKKDFKNHCGSSFVRDLDCHLSDDGGIYIFK